jgi:hypothetical protein
MVEAAQPLDDPVFEVVGIPAEEILRRCSERRRESRRGIRLPRRQVGPAKDAWRLLDFADLSDEDFVREAHRILLGRKASPSELERRLGELGHGSSRMQIVVRLALAPEGRRAARPRVRGLGLRTLVAVGHAIEAADSRATLARAVTTAERGVRRMLSR